MPREPRWRNYLGRLMIVAMLTLGYKASGEQFGPAELLELGIAAEEHGFDSVVVSDHFHPWRDAGGHATFAFGWLGALGQRTRRVRLGTSVVSPSFRYHPAIVAQAAATLAILCGGRFFLGVGAGEALNEVPVSGSPWPPPGERVARLAEAIALIRRLWSEDYVTFEGRFFHTRGAKIFDKPSHPPKLLVAAGGPRTAALAGRLGDGIICTSHKPENFYRDVLMPAAERGARQRGCALAGFERMLEVKIAFDTDARRAIDDTREWAAFALPRTDKDLADPREIERRSAASADQAHTRFIVASEPDRVVEEIAVYIKLGFSHLVFHSPGRDQLRSIRLLARHVLPRLRKLTV